MAQLVALLGPHPATQLDLDLTSEAGRTAWWAAGIVLAGARTPAKGLAATRVLLEKEAASPEALAQRDAAELAAVLSTLGEKRAGTVASRLVRAAGSLAERWGGSLETLAKGSEELAELGVRLTQLAPGVGAATVLRFLRPLREVWPAAEETPLLQASRAAAVHLGWISQGEDEEGAPAALQAYWVERQSTPSFRDVEAALEMLGGRSCLRERPDRCPLQEDCPLLG